jgi:hypothetical protein
LFSKSTKYWTIYSGMFCNLEQSISRLINNFYYKIYIRNHLSDISHFQPIGKQTSEQISKIDDEYFQQKDYCWNSWESKECWIAFSYLGKDLISYSNVPMSFLLFVTFSGSSSLSLFTIFVEISLCLFHLSWFVLYNWNECNILYHWCNSKMLSYSHLPQINNTWKHLLSLFSGQTIALGLCVAWVIIYSWKDGSIILELIEELIL